MHIGLVNLLNKWMTEYRSGADVSEQPLLALWRVLMENAASLPPCNLPVTTKKERPWICSTLTVFGVSEMTAVTGKGNHLVLGGNL